MKSKKRQKSKNYRISPLCLTNPRRSADFVEEPHLLFAGGNRHCDPKTGIPLYGPRSLGTARHKAEVHIGFIGTGEAVDHARQFYEAYSEGVDGDDDHTPFPGCKRDRGYRCDLRTDDALVEPITRQEQRDVLAIRQGRDRFEAMLALLDQKMQILTQRDHPLDYVVLVLPDDLYRRCRSVNYFEKGHGSIHRDLRRAFKSLAMRYQKPTQILLETTTGMTDSRRKLDHPSVVAWNLFNGLYFKVDGLPWGPTDLAPASCFIGISFFRPLGSASTLRTSVVQAFDENGDGLVLRGHRFDWDERDGRTPHLSEEMAAELISMVLERYRQERSQLPQRVVIHKTSRFEPEERAGFEESLRGIGRYDLVSLTPTSHSRLLRAGKYPPLRGTAFTVGDVSFFYTSGYLSSIGRYPHGHVPSPLQVADHIGDTSRRQLLREVMVLTKMNWNSANMAGLMPITLRFSRLVGDVLREVPEHQTPQPKYKYYM
ncbi:MAG: hypothetical protein GXX96_35965 [Planctomycetaceae bacterium]|nr:hypothetical protein [Planctomycetaceae bacterium]